MPEAIAKGKYIRISPYKLSLVADLVRGQLVVEAQRRLTFSAKKGAKILLKILKSAIANGKTKGLKEEDLRVVEVLVGQGPTLKRGRAAAQGSYKRILKRTSHVFIRLSV